MNNTKYFILYTSYLDTPYQMSFLIPDSSKLDKRYIDALYQTLSIFMYAPVTFKLHTMYIEAV